jgi:glycosyltransferase involved in cell wall biosynthesis
MKPVVSVIMITYNHEKFIAEAIDGVINQRCNFPIELLIGEDCSTDRTRDICIEYQRRYPHIIRLIIAEENVGMHKNFFRIFSRAKGLYVAFCEGDDVWRNSSKLSTQVEYLNNNSDYIFAFHNAIVTYANQSFSDHPFNKHLRRNPTVEDIIKCEWFIPTASVMVRREATRNIPKSFANYPCGDYPFSILAAAKGKVHYMSDLMSIYRKNNMGATAAVNKDADTSISYWENFILMLISLDSVLEHRFHNSFIHRIYRVNRRIDYLRFKNGLGFSTLLLWNAFRFQLEEKTGWYHFNNYGRVHC